MSAGPHDDHPHIITYNARWGLILFRLYLAFYGLFVWMSAFRPAVMARPFLWSVNLAILYGIALIVAAILLALLYMAVTKRSAEDR
jgi:uncharacterized membrane protein (DUF485 family)